MALLKRVLLLAAVSATVTTASCYSPVQRPCAFSCADDGACPAGFSCLADGVCHREGDQGSCTIPPQIDAGAGGDAAANDAPTDTGDAAD
jgi:hypothetical protein